uniref:Uncharacterized protein n=1 Tax=viral metagenome TaxID=1070528 RepID=A0A6C0HAX7_9ZZZZ
MPNSKLKKSKSVKRPKSSSKESKLMKFMQTNELAIYFIIFSIFDGINIKKLNKVKISDNEFIEICKYLNENKLSDLIPYLHFILPIVEVLILHSKSDDTMSIKRLFRLFGLENDIIAFMDLFKSKTSKTSRIREVDEFSPDLEIIRKGGSGMLIIFRSLFNKKMKITKIFYTFLSFLGILLSMYCIWTQATRLIKDVNTNENIQSALKLVNSARTCEGVELSNKQKLQAKTAGIISDLFGANGEEHVKGMMILSECLLKDPEKIKLDMKQNEVDIIYNEKPNEEGTTNELVLYNKVDMNDFIMSSGVVPLGFDFDKETFHVEMDLIKRAVIKDKITESELKEVSEKIAKQILKKQPLLANAITDSMKKKDIQPVIPKEPSYFGLLYDVVKDGIQNIDINRIVTGFMTGENMIALYAAELNKKIVTIRYKLKQAQELTEYRVNMLLIDIPLYLGTAYTLLNYLVWFSGNLIAFAYLVKSYFTEQQLAITNGDEKLAITNGDEEEVKISKKTQKKKGGKKQNYTQKSYKK